MTIVPPHMEPEVPDDCYDTWRARGRICVPGRGRAVIDVPIANIYRCSRINGLPLDILIESADRRPELMKHFGVVFSATHPGDVYPIYMLWKFDAGNGLWLRRKRDA